MRAEAGHEMQDARPNIHLHIERLILDGLPIERAQGPHVQAAVEAELSRLLTENGLAASASRWRRAQCARNCDSTDAGQQSHPDGNPDCAIRLQRNREHTMSGQAAVQTQTAAKPTFTPIASGVLQRQCACGQHTSAGGECEECKKKREGTLQRAAINPSPVHEVPPIVHEVLRSPGQPLDAATRAFMEPRFGHDFSGVRVHTDAKAAESARAVNASGVYGRTRSWSFGEGQYVPHTSIGRQLMAHELTHVVQRHMEPQSAPMNLALGSASDRLEREAEQLAYSVTASGPSLAATEGRVKIGDSSATGTVGVIRRQFITPLGQGGRFGGLMERDLGGLG